MTETTASRKTFLNISSFQALAMFRRGLFYSYLSIYLRFFLGLSVTETTFFATFPMILNVAFQTFVWGNVSDKYQKRRSLIILGELCAALITVMIWYAHTLPGSPRAAGYVLIIGLSVVEIFWSMSNVGWSALISDLYPQYQRTAVQGKLASIGALGRVIGVWSGGLAYDGMARLYEGWGFDKGLLFFIASGVMVISTIPMFFVPEGGIRGPGAVKDQADEESSETGGHGYSRHFIMFLLALVLINFGRNGVVTIKTQYLVLDEGFDVSSRLLSHIVNMESAAIFIVGLMLIRLSRRFSDALLLVSSSLLAAVSLMGYVVAAAVSTIFVSNFVWGVSDVVLMASSYSYASKLIPPAQRGKQFALFNATLFLSWGVAGTLIAGPIVDLMIRSGASQIVSYKAAFLAGTLLVIAGIILFTFANKSPRGQS